MATNSLFKTSGLAATTSEQNLYADLVKEAIQIHGHDVNYIDRTLAAKDDIFGEDSLSTYSKQQTIEINQAERNTWLVVPAKKVF